MIHARGFIDNIIISSVSPMIVGKFTFLKNPFQSEVKAIDQRCDSHFFFTILLSSYNKSSFRCKAIMCGYVLKNAVDTPGRRVQNP